MRSWPLVASVAALLGLPAAACTSNAFVCTSDGSCGDGGVCEVDGYCSFADEECNSGRRYGDQSGEKSGECVVSEGGTGSGTGTTSAMSGTTTFEPIDGSSGVDQTSGGVSETSAATSGAAETGSGGSTGGSVDACMAPVECTAETFCDLVDPDWLWTPGELVYGDDTLVLSTAPEQANYFYSSEPFDLREATVTQRVSVLPPLFNGTWIGYRIIDTVHYMAETKYTTVRWSNNQISAGLFEVGGDDDAINPPELLDLIVRSTGGTTEIGFATEDGAFVLLATGPTPAYFESAWIWFELIDSDPDADVTTELDFISICPTAAR